MIKVAVVGAGFMGSLHASCVANNPRAKLVAVVDFNPNAGRALAERYSAQYFLRLAMPLMPKSMHSLSPFLTDYTLRRQSKYFRRGAPSLLKNHWQILWRVRGLLHPRLAQLALALWLDIFSVSIRVMPPQQSQCGAVTLEKSFTLQRDDLVRATLV